MNITFLIIWKLKHTFFGKTLTVTWHLLKQFILRITSKSSWHQYLNLHVTLRSQSKPQIHYIYIYIPFITIKSPNRHNNSQFISQGFKHSYRWNTINPWFVSIYASITYHNLPLQTFYLVTMYHVPLREKHLG